MPQFLNSHIILDMWRHIYWMGCGVFMSVELYLGKTHIWQNRTRSQGKMRTEDTRAEVPVAVRFGCRAEVTILWGRSH